MAILLLIIIYISYIGLGIPDSLFGAAWPVIYREFNLPVSASSIVSMLIYAGTIISSFMGARMIAKLGTAKVGSLSTILTAVALFAFSKSTGLATFCFWAIPLGIGAGAIDVAMNNYVALHYNNMQMALLLRSRSLSESLSYVICPFRQFRLAQRIYNYVYFTGSHCFDYDTVNSSVEKGKI